MSDSRFFERLLETAGLIAGTPIFRVSGRSSSDVERKLRI